MWWTGDHILSKNIGSKGSGVLIKCLWTMTCNTIVEDYFVLAFLNFKMAAIREDPNFTAALSKNISILVYTVFGPLYPHKLSILTKICSKERLFELQDGGDKRNKSFLETGFFTLWHTNTRYSSHFQNCTQRMALPFLPISYQIIRDCYSFWVWFQVFACRQWELARRTLVKRNVVFAMLCVNQIRWSLMH